MVLSDIEIANSVQMKPIKEVAEKLGIAEDALSLYGNYKAKISAGPTRSLKRQDRRQTDSRDSYFSDTSWRRHDNDFCRIG